jgi:hypothetical protein
MMDRIDQLAWALISTIGTGKTNKIAEGLSSDLRLEILTRAKLTQDEDKRAAGFAKVCAEMGIDGFVELWGQLTEEDRRLLFSYQVNMAIPPHTRTLEELTA